MTPRGAPACARFALGFFAALFALGVSRRAAATTYYVDWSAGNDANDGKSRAACGAGCGPWQRAPGMQGFGGTYTHVAGDRFIFRGGVTWPHDVFNWLLSYRDGDPAKPDYYGVDKTWFAGAAWSRPVFDLDGRAPANEPAVIKLYSNDPSATCCAVFEGFEIRNWLVIHGHETGAAAFFMYQAHDVTIRDVYLHGWQIDDATVAHDSYSGGVYENNGGGAIGAGNVLENSQIEDSEAASKSTASGYGVIGMRTVRNNDIHHVPTGILGGIDVHDNVVHDAVPSYDPLAHPNGIYIFSPGTGGVAKAYGNYLYNVIGEALYLSPCFGGSDGTIVAYNNISDPRSTARPIEIDTETGSSGCGRVHLYNNTLVCPPGVSCVRVGNRGFPLGTLVNQNEHYITDATSGLCVGTTDCASVDSLTDTNNVLQTQAAAALQGYTAATQWAPAVSSAVTVDVGVAQTEFATDRLGVARPQLKAWDVGAYEFSPTSPDAGTKGDAAIPDVGADANAEVDARSDSAISDAAVADGALGDIGPDASTDGPTDENGGCGCRAAGASDGFAGAGTLAGAFVVASFLRRRRAPIT